MVEISASILNVDEENSVKTFYDLETAKINMFHIDVMDGKFVKDNTSKKMLEYASNIKKMSNLPLDVHLMVQDAKKYIEEYIALEPSYITVHIEVFDNIEEIKDTIDYIKENGIKVGVAIKPNTDLKKVYPILKYIHLALVMTVEPGKGGQKILPETIIKIEKLKEYRQEENLDFYIEADGGINKDTAKDVKEAGADILVCGTAIVNSDNYKEAVDEIKQ